MSQTSESSRSESRHASMGRMGSSILGLLQARLELFLFELDEEKSLLVRLALWGAFAAIFGLVFLIVVSLLVVFLLPDTWRSTGLVLLGVIYGLMAALSVWKVQSLLKRKSPMFEASLEQLKKDQACLQVTK